MKQILTLVCLFIFNVSFTQTPNGCGNTELAPPIVLAGTGCSQTINYAPDQFTQTKKVRLTLHVVQKSDGTENFQDTPVERNWLKNIMINDVNFIMSNLSPMVLTTTSPYIQDGKIQFEVMDILFHQNTYLWDFNFPNGMSNSLAYTKGNALYDLYVTNNPNANYKTTSIHIFFVDQSGSSAGRACGVPCSNWSVVSTVYQNYLENPSNFWLPSGLIRHELLHNLGLWHSNSYDYCDDTPSGGPFCWNSPACSNNVMDYNASKNALTECQLGRIHYFMTNNPNINNVLVDDDCLIKNDLIINNGAVNIWENTRIIQGNLIIEASSTLVIKCVLNMPKEGKIIIKKGAKLIVDGGTITNQCGQLWRGIEVNGDRSASQLTSGAQGILEIKNDALIENARFAVRTTETDANDQTIWNSFGGIVKVSNSTFKNNRSGIDFSPYQNFFPNNPNSKVKDLSIIKNNTFVWDNTGNLEELGIQFYSHIGMWDNHGIDVIGNTFKNDHPNNTPQYQTGIGIITFDADCRIINNCVSPVYPCPTSNIIPNEFSNLKTGVQAIGISNLARVHIDGNVFNNNKYGVVLEAAHYSSVIRNEFNVPISNLTLQQGGNAIGIYSTNAFGYNFEENTFNSTGPEPVNGSNYAIVADNSLSTGGGLVYKNEFNNMVVGTVSSNDNTLLKIDCNDYNAGNLHQYDWAVTSGALAPQGLCNSQLVDPAKNAFSTNCTGEKHIFVDGSANLLLYSALSNDLPICYTGGKVFNSLCPTGTNSCPSNFANPLSGPQLLSSIGALNNEINNNLLPQLDGGNTQNLLNIINTQSGGQVKNALLAASPYLSDEVLIHYLNQNPAHGLVKQIILANSPVSVQVMEIINNMSLPNGTRNQIESAQTGISDRQLLENDIAVLTRDAQLLKNEFIRLCLDSHQLQDVSTILNQDKTVTDKIALFRLTVEENTPYAAQMINELMVDAAAISVANPADGEADEIEKLCSIYTGIHDAYSNTGSFDSLTGANEVTVTNIANSNSATAVNAQIILNLFKAENFDRYAEPITNNTSSSRLNNTTSNNNQQTVNNYSLNNYPNPFNQNTYIEATLPEGATGQLVITDITGRVVKRIELVANDNKIEISGSQIGYGIFFYSLYVNEQYIRTNKMTRTK